MLLRFTDIYPIVHDFLVSAGLKKTAESLLKEGKCKASNPPLP